MTEVESIETIIVTDDVVPSKELVAADDKKKEAKKRDKEEVRKRKLEQERERQAKKQKLMQEKEAKRKRLEEERERKRKQLEQEKEEKRKKLEQEKEEKRKKLEQEKEMKRKKIEQEKEARELKKRKLEEEKQRKLLEKEKMEQEKLAKLKAKERAQTRLNNFFTVHKKKEPANDVAAAVVAGKNAYETTFLSFHLGNGSKLASLGMLSPANLENKKREYASSQSCSEPHKDTLNWFMNGQSQKSSENTKSFVSAESVVEQINLATGGMDEQELMKLLNQIPMKFVQFYENVRPPYCGTFSKQIKNVIPLTEPFYKVREVDYDYDSDFEWGEGGDDDDEGESEEIEDDDLEDEEQNDDEDSSDLEGFVDETVPTSESGLVSGSASPVAGGSKKRRLIVGNLVPVIHMNTGMCEFDDMEAQIICGTFPIDPFEPKKKIEADMGEVKDKVANKESDKEILVKNNEAQKENIKPAQGAVNVLQPRKKPKVVISNKDDLNKFVKLVEENNDFTLSTLVEILKKNIPGYTKVVVKNTLETVASKEGAKATEKVWVVKSEYK